MNSERLTALLDGARKGKVGIAMLMLANNATLRALRARFEANAAWESRERATCAFRDSHLSPHLAQAIAHYGTAEAAWRKCLRHRAARARRRKFNAIVERLAARALRGEG